MLELYHSEPNMFSLRPLIVLHEKGLEFESHFFDPLEFAQIPFTGTEITYNPEGDGPILVHRGTAMTESFFVCLYLDEAYPETPLRASDAANRWRVLMWARFSNEMLAPALSTLGCKKYLVPELKKRNRKTVEAAVAKIPMLERREGWLAALNDSYSGDLIEDSHRKTAMAVQKVEEALTQGEWLAGDVYSLADIDLFSLLRPLPSLAPDILSGAPKTAAWMNRIASRAAVQKALAMSKTGKPQEAFAPGPEHSRWG